MKALIEALDPLDQLESLAAHSAAIMAFEVTALWLILAGDTSLDGDKVVVK